MQQQQHSARAQLVLEERFASPPGPERQAALRSLLTRWLQAQLQAEEQLAGLAQEGGA